MPTYRITRLKDARAAVRCSGLANFPSWPSHGSLEDFAAWLFNRSAPTIDTYDLATHFAAYVQEISRDGCPVGMVADARRIDRSLGRFDARYGRLAKTVAQIRARRRGMVAMRALAHMGASSRPMEEFARLSAPLRKEVVAALETLRPAANAITSGKERAYRSIASPTCDFLVSQQRGALDRLLPEEGGWAGKEPVYFVEGVSMADLASNPLIFAECTRMIMADRIAATKRSSDASPSAEGRRSARRTPL